MNSHVATPPGVITPLVTFLDAAGEPDREAMTRLVEDQIANGIHGLLAVGSMGEVGLLSPQQRAATVEIVAEAAAGRVPVWAGVGGLGTSETVLAARAASAAGADAVLTLQPLYAVVSDSELEAHFTAVAEAAGIPVIAYDVPVRTPSKLPTPLLAALGESGVIVGVKDSSGDLHSGRFLREGTAHIDGFATYMGSETLQDAAYLLGFTGVVPGFANILPGESVAIFDAVGRGDAAAARANQVAHLELFKILAVEFPGAGFSALATATIKYATALRLGIPLGATNPPMLHPTDEVLANVEAIVAPLLAASVRAS